MPRTSQANAIIKDERKQKIFFAALKLFSTKGFESTKIGDIAQEANISHGLIYHYFASKDEVLQELIVHSTSTAIEYIQSVATQPLSVLERITRIVQRMLDDINECESDLYSTLLMITAIKSGAPAAQLPCILMQYLITEGQSSGEIAKGDAESLAFTLFAAVMGAAQFKAALPQFELPAASAIVDMIK